jgi:hypothetical protein
MIITILTSDYTKDGASKIRVIYWSTRFPHPLFCDGVSISDFIASNVRMVDELEWIRKEVAVA